MGSKKAKVTKKNIQRHKTVLLRAKGKGIEKQSLTVE